MTSELLAAWCIAGFTFGIGGATGVFGWYALKESAKRLEEAIRLHTETRATLTGSPASSVKP